MENASKALLIAAGILIAILTLTTIIILRATFSEYGEKYEETMTSQKMLEFNTQFFKYERNNLTMQDIMTLANLVKEWNNNGIVAEPITLSVSGIGNQDNISYENLQADLGQITTTNTDMQRYTMRVNNEYYASGRIKSMTVTKNT